MEKIIGETLQREDRALRASAARLSAIVWIPTLKSRHPWNLEHQLASIRSSERLKSSAEKMPSAGYLTKLGSFSYPRVGTMAS